MDEVTADLLRDVADKLGTTVEHLWMVLVKQANINASVTLLKMMLFVAFAAAVRALVIRKIKAISLADNEGEDPRLSEEDKNMYRIGAWVLIGISLIYFFLNIREVAIGFFNPEYYALTKIMNYIT